MNPRHRIVDAMLKSAMFVFEACSAAIGMNVSTPLHEGARAQLGSHSTWPTPLQVSSSIAMRTG